MRAKEDWQRAVLGQSDLHLDPTHFHTVTHWPWSLSSLSALKTLGIGSKEGHVFVPRGECKAFHWLSLGTSTLPLSLWKRFQTKLNAP